MTRRPPRRLWLAMAFLALAGLAALGYPHLRRHRQRAAIQSALDARELPLALERIEGLIRLDQSRTQRPVAGSIW